MAGGINKLPPTFCSRQPGIDELVSHLLQVAKLINERKTQTTRPSASNGR